MESNRAQANDDVTGAFRASLALLVLLAACSAEQPSGDAGRGDGGSLSRSDGGSRVEDAGRDAGARMDDAGLDAGPLRSVGEFCVPGKFAPGGFSASEVFLETVSAVCESRMCLVYRLMGDPTPGCTENCADPAEAARRSRCSCRCDGPGPGPFCTCPSGMRCAEVFTSGGPEIVGSYCIDAEL